jgi:NADH:ubiquinone oxidoreductase subunit K
MVDLMTHLDAVDVVHAGGVVHVIAGPDLVLVHVVAAEIVMIKEVVAVTMIAEARRRANLGLVVVVIVANEVVIGVAIVAALVARAQEKKVETDLQ